MLLYHNDTAAYVIFKFSLEQRIVSLIYSDESYNSNDFIKFYLYLLLVNQFSIRT